MGISRGRAPEEFCSLLVVRQDGQRWQRTGMNGLEREKSGFHDRRQQPTPKSEPTIEPLPVNGTFSLMGT
ncbi:unnamed protein product [Nippostrongylus brasiliensis]|uniref:Uncharacterized protein n=1 Tax=Nippostrongylus brasiliensis TaxID=27835 RepID=A0A0N4Y1N7_NIPBR|nr:unnamed protein product [Nippostrongylus brasiliensis]